VKAFVSAIVTVSSFVTGPGQATGRQCNLQLQHTFRCIQDHRMACANHYEAPTEKPCHTQPTQAFVMALDRHLKTCH
jgi:hypothetical protein